MKTATNCDKGRALAVRHAALGVVEQQHSPGLLLRNSVSLNAFRNCFKFSFSKPDGYGPFIVARM